MHPVHVQTERGVLLDFWPGYIYRCMYFPWMDVAVVGILASLGGMGYGLSVMGRLQVGCKNDCVMCPLAQNKFGDLASCWAGWQSRSR